MNKELEEAIKTLVEENTTWKKEKAIKTLRSYIENSIPKQIVEEKQNELQKEYEEALEENSTKAFILKCKLEMIKELLDESNIIDIKEAE